MPSAWRRPSPRAAARCRISWRVRRAPAAWLVGGTIPLVGRQPGKVRAACLVYDERGARVARYDKIHLSTSRSATRSVTRNIAFIEAGEEPVVVATPFGRLVWRSATTCASRNCSGGCSRRVRRSSPCPRPSPSAWTRPLGAAGPGAGGGAGRRHRSRPCVGGNVNGRETGRQHDRRAVGRDSRSPPATRAWCWPSSIWSPCGACAPPSQHPSPETERMSGMLERVRKTLLEPAGIEPGAPDRLLGGMLSSQVDYADLYFQYSRHEAWSLEEGRVKSGSHNIEQGGRARGQRREIRFRLLRRRSAASAHRRAPPPRAIARAGRQRRAGRSARRRRAQLPSSMPRSTRSPA